MPMIWRGPMVMSALTQMLREVEWGELDVMVVDMLPGTGDAQLTMAQQVPLAGAVIVSTPQDLALIDARRGIAMFRRVNVPVLGIVENMSTFICPHCGGRSDIFGHGGARHEAERLGVPFLGEVPLDLVIRETSDAGRPVVATDPDGEHAAIFRRIAERVRDGLGDEFRHILRSAIQRIERLREARGQAPLHLGRRLGDGRHGDGGGCGPEAGSLEEFTTFHGRRSLVLVDGLKVIRPPSSDGLVRWIGAAQDESGRETRP